MTPRTLGYEPSYQLYQVLTKLFCLLDDADRQFFREFGLSTRQFWALHHLSQAESLTMIALSRLIVTDKSNVTAIIDRLEADQLVERRPVSHDRRVSLVALTAKGHALYASILAAHQARMHDVMGDEASVRTAIDILAPIMDRLDTTLHPYTLANSLTTAGEG
jgi:DNA-binding MarR family transcriptional regulator